MSKFVKILNRFRAAWLLRKQIIFRWRRWPRRKKIIFSATAPLVFVIFGLLVYYISALIMVSPGEMRLAELKESWEKEKICHEACALGRRGTGEKIVKILAEDKGLKSKTARRLRTYFLDENLRTEFRAELIALLRRAQGQENPPGYILDYLADGPASALRAAIINIYGLSPEAALSLLLGEEDLGIKLAAIRALSNYQDKEVGFSLTQLDFIGDLVLNSATESRLRRPLVLLLSDYYLLFPSETKEVLKAVYKSQESGDEISRVFAADIYNNFRGGDEEELVLPAVSEAQWEEYYNN